MFKSDLWSIGVLLYLILFGEMPFTGKNVSTLVKNITRGQLNMVQMPEEMEHLSDLIYKLL
jgi:serine/threonine protein kinase